MQSSTELAPAAPSPDEALLEKIEELSLIRELNDRLAQAPTYAAACQMLVDMVQDERGADAVESDAEPWATPMAWARKRGHDEIVDLLRSAGSSDRVSSEDAT